LSYGFTVEVWGDYACFSRPELKVERVSYEVITPSAARGILEAVFWKPEIKYVIDEIAVCAPIKFENIRRNEVNSKIPYKSVETAAKALEDGKLETHAANDRAQRAAIVLRDVRYVIKAHFELTEKAGAEDTTGKYTAMIRRRLEKGQCFHMPYLGTREFPANIRLIEDDYTPENITRLLGLMFYDFEYEKTTDKQGDTLITGFNPTYFMAELVNGVINLRDVEVLR